MDDLVTVCSWNANGIMVWARMLWQQYALETRTELWLGHGCFGNVNHDWGMDPLVTICTCSGNTNGILVCAWMLS